MRLGLVVDGESEYRTLPEFVRKIDSPSTCIRVLRADIQPLSNSNQIAKVVEQPLRILQGLSADVAVILLDLESRNDCPGEWANEIKRAIRTRACSSSDFDVEVVLKVRTFENWLVADTDALSSINQRFQLSNRSVRQITPNKADNAPGIEILKRSAVTRSYEKVKDAARILRVADPTRIGENSRSFRRFLRIVGHPTFQNQSIAPT